MRCRRLPGQRGPQTGFRRSAVADDEVGRLLRRALALVHVSMVQSRSIPLSLNPHWPHFAAFACIALALLLGFTRLTLLGEPTALLTVPRTCLLSVKISPTRCVVMLCSTEAGGSMVALKTGSLMVCSTPGAHSLPVSMEISQAA